MVDEKIAIRKTLEELIPDIKDLDKSIELEITNVCNAVCNICPREEQHRVKGFMTKDTLEMILKRAKVYGVNSISIGGFGEPLLHKEFCSFLKTIRKELPECKVSITTNGVFLTPEKLHEMIEIGIPEISLSFHSPDKEEYERIMRISYPKVVENIKYFINTYPEEINNLRMGIVKTKENQFQIEELMEYWTDLGLKHFTVLTAHNRAGQLNDNDLIDDAFYKEHNVPINSLDNRMCSTASVVLKFIDWQGIVHLCCNDLKSKALLGNLREDSLLSSENNRQKVWKHSQKDFCKTCNMPSTLKKAELISFV